MRKWRRARAQAPACTLDPAARASARVTRRDPAARWTTAHPREGGSLEAALTVVAILLWGFAPAAEPGDLRRLFPHEADLFVTEPGLTRLDLPAEVMAACRQDLSDLRLFDREGSEIAFLIDSLAPPGSGVETTQRFDAPISELRRSQIRRKSAPPLRRETFEIALPQASPVGGGWVLVFETGSAAFVARVSVESLAEGGEVAHLVENGTLFRLAGARRAEKTRLELPPFKGPRLRVTLETEDGDWIQPDLLLESTRPLERPRPIEAPLAIVARERADGATVLDLARPRGLVPDLLRLETATGTFDRRIEVRDEGPGLDALLGSAQLFRIESLAEVEDVDLALAPARGDRLRVRIEDGDSPPLAELRFTAVVRQPSLIFSTRAAGGSGPTATLFFGGGRAFLPRYDLAGLALPSGGSVAGVRAAAVARLYDPGALGRARLGPVRANPTFDRTPALAFAMRPAAEIDARLFSHRRSLRVPESPEGLVKLTLAPADLAVLREDLADLRIVDQGSKQWPYLLEPDAAEAMVHLPVTKQTRHSRVSRYRLNPPVGPVRIDRIVLETEAAFFDRAARLRAEPAAGPERELWAGRLARRSDESSSITIALAPARIASLDLEIEDGDDAPLIFRSVRARAPLPGVFLAAPAGEYTLLLGAPRQEPPRYELARVRDVVLAIASVPVTAGDLIENPRYSLPARLGSRGGREQAVLGIALVAAVLVLLALTLRLARREGGESRQV